jgi:hypothetical protein
LDEARDPGRRAAEFPKESPGLEGGNGLLDQCPDLRVGPVDGLLTGGQLVPPAAVGRADCAACALVALVSPAGDVGVTGFSWRDYRDLLIAAHQQLGGPIILVWDNLNVHKAADLRECPPPGTG